MAVAGEGARLALQSPWCGLVGSRWSRVIDWYGLVNFTIFHSRVNSGRSYSFLFIGAFSFGRHSSRCVGRFWGGSLFLSYEVAVRGCSASSDVSSDISLSPLYIPPHCH